jgi:hypothetical protein
MASLPKKKMKQLLEENGDAIARCPRPARVELPEFPTNLTLLPSKQLGDLYARYTSVIDYVGERLSEERVREKFCKIELRKAKANVAFSARGIKLQKWAAIYRDSRVIELMQEELDAAAQVVGLSSVLWTIKDYLRAIEFERDRRFQEMRTEGR